jgi:hypothetical protein
MCIKRDSSSTIAIPIVLYVINKHLDGRIRV